MHASAQDTHYYLNMGGLLPHKHIPQHMFCLPVMYPTAGTLFCAAIVRNSGNVRISNVVVYGDSNNCSQAVLLPDQLADCFVWKTLIREDFTADTFTIAFTDLSGTPAGSVAPLSTVSGGSVTVANPNKFVALLSASVEVNTTSVTKAGESVLYTVKLVSYDQHGF